MTNYESNSYHVIDDRQETSAAFSTLPPEASPDSGDAVMKLWHTTELPDGQPVNVSVLFTADDIKGLQSFLNDQFGRGARAGGQPWGIDYFAEDQPSPLPKVGDKVHVVTATVTGHQPDVDLFQEQVAALSQDTDVRQCAVIYNGVQCIWAENHAPTPHDFDGRFVTQTGDGAATPPADQAAAIAPAAESATGGGAPDVAPSPSAGGCPSCGSPQPSMHRAVSGGGEVTSICPDSFHDQRGVGVPASTDEKPKRKRRTKLEIAFDTAKESGDPQAIQHAAEALRAKDPGNSRLAETLNPPPVAQPPAEAHGQAWIGPSFAPDPSGSSNVEAAFDQQFTDYAQGAVPAFQPGQTQQLGETAISPEEQKAASGFPCPHQSSDGRTCVRPYGHEIQTENNPEPKPHVYATIPSQLGVTTAQAMQAVEQSLPAFQAAGHPAPTAPLSFQVPPTPAGVPAPEPTGAVHQPPAPAAPFWQQPQG